MICSNTDSARLNMNVDKEQIKQVQHFPYQGRNIIEDSCSKTNMICIEHLNR